MESKFQLPTETVELPSKGLLYPEDSPLAKGTIEMKYMTAKEEDILTNQNYIQKGTVIDKLLQSLIVEKEVDYNQLLIGDKNAIMVAARILSYGKDYSFNFRGEELTIDLTSLNPKVVDYSLYENRKNQFTFTLPTSSNIITYKVLTHEDEKAIDRELQGLKKLNKEESPEVTTRLKHMILSVNGIADRKEVREFVDGYLLAKDARALREEYSKITPDVNLVFPYENENGVEEDVDLPIGLNFFWPDA
jgi:hypothetical protein